MKLLVAGCSHSAGSEILEKWHPRCPEHAWGGHLANYFNVNEYINLAGPGYSNQWIYRSVNEFLESNSPDDLFVIIGWTNAGRIPVYCYEKNEVVHLCPNHRNLSVFGSFIQRSYENLYGTMLPLEILVQQEHYRIVGMQSTLKSLGIKYLFFDAVSNNHENCSSKLVDCTRYYRYGEHMNSYWNYYLTNIWDKSDRWANHAPPEYHKSWANNLIEFIEKNNLLKL